MKDEKSFLIDSVRKYIMKYPKIDDLSKLGVDFLSNDTNSYSIEPQPVKPLIEKNVFGEKKKQFVFVFATRFDYSDERRQNIDNSGFYEEFSDWIESNSDKGILPELKDNQEPLEMEVLTSGYLFDIANGMKSARYQIQMKLIYLESSQALF